MITTMNFLSFFTREEPIAGLAIEEDVLRLVLLKRHPETGQREIQTFATKTVSRGVITDGIITDRSALTASLKKLLARSNVRLNYFIVSIPANQTYYKIFSFPKNIDTEQLEEAMGLVADFQLPFAADDVEIDWEKVIIKEEWKETTGPSHVVALAVLKKKVTNEYLACLNDAGIKTVALEIHPQSIERVSSEDKTGKLIIHKTPSNVLLYIIEEQTLRFLRSIPNAQLQGKELSEEIRKIANFYETTAQTTLQILPLDAQQINASIATNEEMRENISAWMIALGAAARGALPRKSDDLISLMPLGTEKAYEYQRAASFSIFLTHLAITFSIFFAASFLAAFALMIMIQENFSKQINALPPYRLPKISLTEDHAKRMNVIIAQTSTLVKTLPRWSGFMEELIGKIPSDITISNLSIPSPGATISMSGVAKNRVALNNFRKTLQGWPTITSLDLPTTNLDQREDIPFQASFVPSDPQFIYNWK